MQQLKALIQKNTLLFMALCMAISSITLGCDTSCQNKALQKDKLTIELIPAGDITQQAVATITLKKTAGYTNLGDIILTFTDHDKFVEEDGTALAATMKLSELLGQEATTGMESEITLKIKAATATATANVDAQLKIAVGNSKDAGQGHLKKDHFLEKNMQG